MSNPVKGTVTHEIDGKTITLRLGTNEWCELEEEHGKKTSEILADFAKAVDASILDMRFLRSLFRAAISAEQPEATVANAGELMSEIGLTEAATLIGRTIQAGMPEVPDQPGKPEKPAARR